MYKAYNKLLPVNLQSCFSLITEVSNRSYRSKHKFKVSYVRTYLRSMSLTLKGIKLWNQLDETLIKCNNIAFFKKSLKRHYLTRYKLETEQNY